MKTLISGLFLAVLLSLLSTSLFAQTEDGETPAVEGVCEDEDWLGQVVTPGLEGLCVAYCEALDCDSYESEEDQPRACNQVLANYDRKKTDSDPDMPCTEAEAVCPCWNMDHLAAADQLLNDLETIAIQCVLDDDPPGAFVVYGPDSFNAETLFQATIFPGSPPQCGYVSVDPDMPPPILPTPGTAISLDEFEVCRDQLEALTMNPLFLAPCLEF